MGTVATTRAPTITCVVRSALEGRLTSMLAMGIEEFGGPEQLRPLELPRPEPGADEVLVRVRAAGVGDWDRSIRIGDLRMNLPLPMALEGGSRHRRRSR